MGTTLSKCRRLRSRRNGKKGGDLDRTVSSKAILGETPDDQRRIEHADKPTGLPMDGSFQTETDLLCTSPDLTSTALSSVSARSESRDGESESTVSHLPESLESEISINPIHPQNSSNETLVQHNITPRRPRRSPPTVSSENYGSDPKSSSVNIFSNGAFARDESGIRESESNVTQLPETPEREISNNPILSQKKTPRIPRRTLPTVPSENSGNNAESITVDVFPNAFARGDSRSPEPGSIISHLPEDSELQDTENLILPDETASDFNNSQDSTDWFTNCVLQRDACNKPPQKSKRSRPVYLSEDDGIDAAQEMLTNAGNYLLKSVTRPQFPLFNEIDGTMGCGDRKNFKNRPLDHPLRSNEQEGTQNDLRSKPSSPIFPYDYGVGTAQEMVTVAEKYTNCRKIIWSEIPAKYMNRLNPDFVEYEKEIQRKRALHSAVSNESSHGDISENFRGKSSVQTHSRTRYSSASVMRQQLPPIRNKNTVKGEDLGKTPPETTSNNSKPVEEGSAKGKLEVSRWSTKWGDIYIAETVTSTAVMNSKCLIKIPKHMARSGAYRVRFFLRKHVLRPKDPRINIIYDHLKCKVHMYGKRRIAGHEFYTMDIQSKDLPSLEECIRVLGVTLDLKIYGRLDEFLEKEYHS